MKNPLIAKGKLSEIYSEYSRKKQDDFIQLKANEERLNEIFADIYGAGDVINPTADNDSIIIGVADYTQDMKSLIAYAVGCMFGRYSLGRDGLVYAGGTWDSSLYPIFAADADNIISRMILFIGLKNLYQLLLEKKTLKKIFPLLQQL